MSPDLRRICVVAAIMYLQLSPQLITQYQVGPYGIAPPTQASSVKSPERRLIAELGHRN